MRAPLADFRAVLGSSTEAWPDMTFNAELIDGINQVLAVIPESSEPAPTELMAAVDRVLKKFDDQVPTTRLDRLYAKVLKSPQDRAASVIWVDALLEAGDPRGRFGRLQLVSEERSLDPTEHAEQEGLAQANTTRWLGAVESCVTGVKFRRGVLSVVTANPDLVTPVVLDDPSWRTVEQLSSTVAHIQHRNLVSLRRLGTSLLPDPHDTQGIVGFQVWSGGEVFDVRGMESIQQAMPQIEHLETNLAVGQLGSWLPEVFPNLRLLRVSAITMWDMDESQSFWSDVRGIPEIVLHRSVPGGYSDGWWLEMLPRSTVHVHGLDVSRSYLRRDDGIHAVFTHECWKESTRLEFLELLRHLPAMASMAFRSNGTVPADVVDAMRARLPGANILIP